MSRRSSEDTWSYPPGPGDLEPFELGSGDLGVLLIHGFCGTPPEMRDLGEHLAAAGFRVRGALLAGHGSTPEELERTTWTDWLGSAQEQLDTLKKEARFVFCAGQSMGGTVSLALAARNPDVTAVATCAALVSLGRLTETQIRIGRRVIRWHYPDRGRVDLWNRDAVSRLRNYNRRAMKSHVDLVGLYTDTRRSLHLIKQPALILHGLRDATVPHGNAATIKAAIGESATVRYFDRSGHAMSIDIDAPEIQELITEHFLNAATVRGWQVTAPSQATPSAS
ncbi:MAG TPA: alpha/beta fold hydrolase [Candidatus Dormibacteraeota bacterium]|nr:alpha/beta fold hydrolase [Candidatus Dormibacteraeota bacterium]